MIRTTFQSVNRRTQSVIQGRYAELAALQVKMATGKALNRPSDGAIETANVMKLKTQNVQLKQYEKNINDGLAWMQITDTSMTSMNSIIHRAKELAIQGDTDTLSPTEREYINNEIEQLTMQMVSLMNTQYKGDYIFSGAATNKSPVLLRETSSTQADKTAYDMSFFNAAGAAVVPLDANGQIPSSMPPASAIPIYNPNGNQYALANSPENLVTRIVPGSLDIYVDGRQMEENVDYKVDYSNGQLWLIDSERKYFPNGIMEDTVGYDPALPTENPQFIKDSNGRLIDNPSYDNTQPTVNPQFVQSTVQHPMAQDFFTSGAAPATSAAYTTVPKLEMRLNYMDNNTNIYGEELNTNSRILRQIEEDVSLEINTSMSDFEADSGTNILSALIELGQGLLNGNSEEIRAAMDNLDDSMSQILSRQAINGAMINRFETSLERNEYNQVETTRLQSNIEDADYAETIAEFAILKTVFDAALNSTARIMQTSLADYLR